METPKKPKGRPPSDNPADDYIHVRVTSEEKERYFRSAQKAGETLSAWIKSVLGRASKR